ncbi:hypothetical protein DH2020_038143 [Rehmannia glutinosa]|uniref:Uncharacterized protein n=1 Tax=Rehmannia glutinosa TaxID=99300 RepID=A0ABR0V156_REHGL
MEGSNSEAIFESLNLSPQLFINEVLNIVDDLLDEAFSFYLQEASTLLKTEGTDRSAELNKGVAYIRDLIQLTLDQRMQKWEEYCLRFCFRVPEGFSLPKVNELSGDDLPDLDALTDTELDAQLNSLRNRLTLVGKESAELGRELRALERQSLSSNQSAGSIDEALQLYRKDDATQLFQELAVMSSEFRAKVGKLKRRMMEEIQCDRADRLRVRHGDVLRMPRNNGLFGAKLEELQQFLDEITTS